MEQLFHLMEQFVIFIFSYMSTEISDWRQIMGQTIVEKILSKVKGKNVYAGDEELFSPDRIIAYDYPGYIDVYWQQMKDLSISKVKDSSKFVLFIDHFYPAGGGKEQNVHQITRDFAKEYGLKLIEGEGIGHQLSIDKGLVKPGDFVVHFDGHVSSLGSIGAFGIGIRNSMIEAFATEEISLVVPSTTRIDLIGKLSKGVAARDLFIKLLDHLGPAGALSTVVEYGGEGLSSLNIDDRFVICNLAMFIGAVSAIAETDSVTTEYISKHLNEEAASVHPDSDAKYDKTITIDLGEIVPMLSLPHSPANTAIIDVALGKPVNVGLVGSCASGRITDFAQVVQVLKGKKIAEGFRLTMVPTTVEIQNEIARNGMMSTLIEAGARIHYPSCDFCFGVLGALSDGEIALSTGTLNVPGRMGNTKADIYNASPYTIAASALHGKIVDPRDVL